MSNCIRYAYSNLNRDCFMHNSLNLSNSYYKSVNILAYSIKSDFNYFSIFYLFSTKLFVLT